MKKLAFGALFVGLLAACGSNNNNNHVILIDGPAGDGTDVCNVLTQTGCMAGEKCTWFQDATMPQPLGHIGCAPDNGTIAVGAACTYGAPGTTGFDNCMKGDVCSSGVCKVVCDQNLGTPMCPANYACTTYEGLFGPVGQAVAAGVCDKTCDPLTDNDFDGSAAGGSAKTGSACTATQGCYGFPDSMATTNWSCANQHTDVTHRTACTTANQCANSGGNPYLNGCAQGYIPLLYDMTGSTQVDCIAICKPDNCYPGQTPACTNAQIAGVTPYQCKVGYERGTFDTATAGNNNGDHCIYSWYFEEGANGLMRSPTSDTIGFCMNHKKYMWDPTGGSNYTTPWPRCDDGTVLTAGAGIGSGSAVGAADFGCVSTAVGGVTFQGKNGQPKVVDKPRMMYHGMMKQ